MNADGSVTWERQPMDAMRLDKISRTYRRHPLRAATIKERLLRTGRFTRISEDDLAIDEMTFVTDQNHTGGQQAVIELAQLVGLKQSDRVLDIGTGLGGTPRVIAQHYGCRCLGIELTEARYHDAIELTRLTGLENLVTLSCGDFLTSDLPARYFNLIIGQDTFMHFDDLAESLHKCSTLLAPDGWLAIDDGFLRRAPANQTERQKLTAAWDQWNGRFPSLKDWESALQSSGFHCCRFDDRTPEALREYDRKMKKRNQPKQHVEEHELSGWHRGEELIRAEVIGIMRMLCRLQTLHCST